MLEYTIHDELAHHQEAALDSPRTMAEFQAFERQFLPQVLQEPPLGTTFSTLITKPRVAEALQDKLRSMPLMHTMLSTITST